MRKFFTRLTGIVLIGTALLGLATSITGVVGVWSIKDNVQAALQSLLNTTDSTLQVTADGLQVADNSLTQARTAVDTLVNTIQTTGKSMQEALPLLDTVTRITTQDLPGTVLATQVALDAAQTSAMIIDNTMQLLSSIPLLGIQKPAVEAPLSTAIEEVSKSLDPVPSSLASMEESFTTASQNVTTFEGKFNQIAGDIGRIGTSLDTARGVVTRYQDLVAGLQAKIDRANRRLPGTITLAAWLCTAMLAWLALTQLAILGQGLEMAGVKWMQPPAAIIAKDEPVATSPAVEEAADATPAEVKAEDEKTADAAATQPDESR